MVTSQLSIWYLQILIEEYTKYKQHSSEEFSKSSRAFKSLNSNKPLLPALRNSLETFVSSEPPFVWALKYLDKAQDES